MTDNIPEIPEIPETPDPGSIATTAEAAVRRARSLLADGADAIAAELVGPAARLLASD